MTRHARTAVVVAFATALGCTNGEGLVQLDITFLYPSDDMRQRSAASHAWVLLAPEGTDPCADLVAGAADPFDTTFRVLADVATASPALDTVTANVPAESIVLYAEAADFRGDRLLAGCTSAALTGSIQAISVDLLPVGIVDCAAPGSPDGALCDDGDECTVDDTCSGGTCVGGRPRDCSSVVGECLTGRCVTGMGCVPEPSPDGAPCNDGLSCSTGESCTAGVCRGGDRSTCCPGPDCTEYDCDNGLDEDDDFRVDCDDSDCDLDPACRIPENCTNGFDDDGDGDADCDDFDCASHPACAGCTDTCPDADIGTATGTSVYTGDTRTSCDRRVPSCTPGSTAPDITLSWRAPRAGRFRFDTFGSAYDTVLAVLSSCAGSTLGCNDGTTTSQVEVTLTSSQSVVILIDGAGASSGTFRLNITEVVTTETGRCADGLDNDGDGPTDCADSDCAGDPACNEGCDDGFDDDGDGRVDCEDMDCFGDAACGEIELCGNSSNDDGDSDTDCADTECAGCAAVCLSPASPVCHDSDIPMTATLPITRTGSTVGRCSRYQATCVASSSVASDMAFRFTPATSGAYRIAVTPNATTPTFAPAVHVREFDPSTCRVASFGDLGCSTTGVLASASLLGGVPVLIIVDGNGEDEGDFTLSITSAP